MLTRILVNPHAGGGNGRRLLPRLRQELDAAKVQHDVAESSAPGELTVLAQHAREQGVERLVIVGGDGSVNEVVQAYVDAQGEAVPGPELVLVPAGTGGDLRRTFGISSLEDALSRLTTGTSRAVDIGLVELTRLSGAGSVRRAFINVTSFGLGGTTDRFVAESPRWLGGKAAYVLAAARAIAVNRNAPLRLLLDGEPWLEDSLTNVAVCNGRYFGGGMHVAPHADPTDSWLDVVAFVDMSKLASVALSLTIYDGKHLDRSDVRVGRARELRAELLDPSREVLVDVDGEVPGKLPLSIKLLPGALRVRA